MSWRTDEAYAKRYEADKEWYDDFCMLKPTAKQFYTIRQIENRYSFLKFEGKTREDTSNFIDEYGNPIYNAHSNRKYIYGY